MTAIDYIEDESLIPVDDVMITLTNKGYIKRLAVDTYKLQNKGGVGVKGMSTNEEDFVEHMLVLTTHDYLMFFTNKGKIYRMKGYEVPEFSRHAKGLPIINLLPLEKDEKVTSMFTVSKKDDAKFLVFVTKDGLIKRCNLSEFDNIRKSGKIAITLKENDELIAVLKTNGSEFIAIASSNGRMVRFDENEVRIMGRSSSGVKGIDKMNTPFLLGKSTKYKAQFATDDIITAIYYSGFGKSNATKNIIKSIENSSASRQSKDYALNKLDELTVLLQKHTERENPSKYVYPISSYGKQWGRVSAEDSKLRAAAKYPYGKIPESLINPTTVADVRDRLKIERLAQELSAWFGAGRQSSGTVELFGNIQLPNNANAKGNRFDNLGKVTLTDAFGKVMRFQKNGIITSDNVAEETARNALTILKNVKDGGGIANDVIFGTDTYRTLRFKNGSRIEQIRKLRTKVTS